MTRKEELVEVLNRRYKKIMEDPKIFESIIMDADEVNATVDFNNGKNIFSAIFEYKINSNKSYWYCVRDWED